MKKNKNTSVIAEQVIADQVIEDQVTDFLQGG